jgi:plastocyanin
MRLRRFAPAAASCGALLLYVAPSAAAAPHTYEVVIDKLKFGPVPAQLHKGDTLVWVNHDFLRHSATATNHAFDADLQPGARVRMVITANGTYPFFCKYHPGMRGVLQIR